MSGQQRNDGGGGFSAYLCLINHLWTLEAPGFISLSLFFFSCVFLLSSRPFIHSPAEIPSLPWTPLHVSPPFCDFFGVPLPSLGISHPFLSSSSPSCPGSGPHLQERRRRSSNSCSSPELRCCSHQPPTEPHTPREASHACQGKKEGGKKITQARQNVTRHRDKTGMSKLPHRRQASSRTVLPRRWQRLQTFTCLKNTCS